MGGEYNYRGGGIWWVGNKWGSVICEGLEICGGIGMQHNCTNFHLYLMFACCIYEFRILWCFENILGTDGVK